MQKEQNNQNVKKAKTSKMHFLSIVVFTKYAKKSLHFGSKTQKSQFCTDFLWIIFTFYTFYAFYNKPKVDVQFFLSLSVKVLISDLRPHNLPTTIIHHFV